MSEQSPDGQLDIVYTDGEVLTGAYGAAAEGILIRGGRVAAVGSNAEVVAEAGSGVPRQSLHGATVIPGLVDTHPHLMHFAAFYAQAVHIFDARDHQDIVDAVSKRAAEIPPGEWIVTTPVGEPHYFARRSYRDLTEGVLPDRAVLDRATSEHPVFIQAWAPTTPNVVAANSAALAALGISADSPDRVANVWIDKDAAGNPTGILRGSVNAYYNQDPFFAELVEKMPPLIQPELLVPELFKAMAKANAAGVTTIFEAHAMEPIQIELYKMLRAQKLLTVRVQASPELEGSSLIGDQPKSMTEISETLQAALAGRSLTDDWLRVDGITTCAWGLPNCGFMWWPEGYTDPWGQATTGQRQITEEKMQLAFDFCAQHGLRLNLCGASPAEHDEYLQMTADVMAKYGLARTGWLLEHGYFLREDQPKKYADLGFDMTISIGFTFGTGDMVAERIGSDALKLLNPLRHLLDAGLTVGASSDWGPANPFDAMRLAVTHQMFPSGRYNDGPAQVITRQESFDMWTRAAGKVLGWEGIGVLTPGSHADLAIIDRNPITCDLDALPQTQVLRTTVAGRIVHDNAALDAPAVASTA
jgi:predicted amidohydrolase YtcJ